MEWIDRLNASLNYIEEHLTEEIRIEELARIACCSSYHYQRMFTYIAGLPLSEYLRRRRMSIAAVELQQSEIKVIDLAPEIRLYFADRLQPGVPKRAWPCTLGRSQAGLLRQNLPADQFPDHCQRSGRNELSD